MRVELPNNQWAEIRENLKGGDRKAFKAAVKFKVSTEGGVQEIAGDIQESQRLAVLRRLITSWSLTDFPMPIYEPPDTPEPVLERLDLDYLDPMLEAIEPLIDRIERSGKSSTTSTQGSSDGQPQETPPASATSQPTS